MPEELNDARILKLQKQAVGEERMEISDKVTPGLRLRITAGTVNWSLSSNRPGDRRLRTILGHWPEMGVVQARLAAQALIVDEKARKATQSIRIRTLIIRYQAEQASGLKRADETILAIGRYLKPLGNAKIGILTSDDLAFCGREMVKHGPAAANRALSYVNSMFNWGVRMGLIETNPAKDVEWPGIETPRDRVHTPQELAEIWDVCDIIGEPFGSIVRLMMLTLAKRSQLVLMRIEDVSLPTGSGEGLWTIPAQSSKTGAPIEIPLVEPAVDILRKVIGTIPREGLAFPASRRKPISGFSSRKARLDYWIQISRYTRPGMDWQFGDLRRSFQNLMEANGRVSGPVIDVCLDRKIRPAVGNPLGASTMPVRLEGLRIWWGLLEGWLETYSSLPEWRRREQPSPAGIAGL